MSVGTMSQYSKNKLISPCHQSYGKRQTFEMPDTPAIVIDTEEDFKKINDANDGETGHRKRPRFKPKIDD